MTTTVPQADYDELSNPSLIEHTDCPYCTAGRMCRERAAELRTWTSILQGRLRDLQTEVAQLRVEARLVPLTPNPATRRGWMARQSDQLIG